MKKRILGLDTGTNSLGWAVVDRNETGEYSLIRKGSLIFQEGVKIEKGIESSKAAERSQHRASRKHYFRRRLRKIELLKVLIKYGWCPYISDEELNLWHTKKKYPQNDEFMLWQRTNDNFEQNPYYYRHVCLHEELDLTDPQEAYMLGRALYHMVQRRGFLSNRLDQSEDDEATGAVKSAISDLSKDMAKADCKYLGDYFYLLYKNEGNTVRIRSRYTDREEHYKKEFYAICERQNLSAEQIKELERAMYFQRPLKSQRQGVGKCPFETKKVFIGERMMTVSKQRCADSHPDFELFRMLSVLNNIKVKGPYDIDLRSLNDEEIKKALPAFYRKSKPNFDFEDIAKAIAGKNKYQYIKDKGDKAYKFNYRMSQGISGCPTIAQLMSVFGDNYADEIASVYTGKHDTTKEAVDAVWNVLYSFQDKEHVKQWGIDKLQLNDSQAEQFSKIRLSHNFASLSLSAIRKILPWMQQGMIYSHAVSMAKVPDIVGKEIWHNYGETITKELTELIINFNPKDETMQGTLDFCIKDYLQNNYSLDAGVTDGLYHPSMIETYPDAKRNGSGVYQLGSPRTNAVRNPMAMRSLHELRKVINLLLLEGTIDQNTEVHIEYARELNDSNKRWAIGQWNKDRENKRKKSAEEIQKLYKEQTGISLTPTDTDLLKYELWEEQNHICLYTGEQIGIADFVGANPKYDIEHTIPRSVGGDSTLENMTLCSSRFNREVKKTKLPTELTEYEDIMARLEPIKEQIEKLRKDADRIRTHSGMAKEQKDRIIRKRHLLRQQLDYLQGKYRRFTMTEVPDGFARRQGAGIGLVGKYAGLYLKSLFHKPEDRNHSNVRVVKGATTAEYRKMWGIQNEYQKKSRDNHIHHCIDAITIACIEPGQYNETARYYQQLEEYERGRGNKPQFAKPWPTFTEDILALEREMIVVHDTPDNVPKHTRKYVQTAKGKKLAKGDTARGALNKGTFYGAIERDGNVKYVVRRNITDFTKSSDADKIVDDVVREIVKKTIAEKGLKEAISGKIYMNREKGIVINKVRCYVADSVAGKIIPIKGFRDRSQKEYKQQTLAESGDNYAMAIYEGMQGKKIIRDYDIINKIDAVDYYNHNDSELSILPTKKIKGTTELKIKYRLSKGLHVLLYETVRTEVDFDNQKELVPRLYVITGLSTSSTTTGGKSYKYGMVTLKYSQEARQDTECPEKKGLYKNNEPYRAKIVVNHNQFNALVEGYDFEINKLGDIKMLR